MDTCSLNQNPRFFTDVTGTILVSPTQRLSMFTFANCCLVPVMMNSVLLSFKVAEHSFLVPTNYSSLLSSHWQLGGQN